MIVHRKVLEEFQYAGVDGKTPRRMRVGKSYPFDADHAARFEQEGYLAPPEDEKAAKVKRTRKAK